MDVALVAAVAENGVIGRENGIPWKLSTDLRRFKADTIGKPVIMGRKTFASLGKPLPERVNIVITHDKDFRADGVEVVHSLADALTLADIRGRCMAGASEIAVIGGGQIYGEVMERADRLRITHVLAEVEGDTRFPPIDPLRWQAVASEDFPAGPRDSFHTRYVVYERR